ncbi:MAG: cadmium-translocating P-type ATPase [Myxococcales bacterium]|nr:cadmium-translocating P-type ATPase [Myxococcales bacterium]
MSSERTTVAVFRIRGMDCAEEVATLKAEIGPLVGGEQYLSFDIVNGKMRVDATQASVEAIEQAVAATGMSASPWTDDAASDEQSWWQRRGRAVMCLASAVLLVAAVLTHALAAGGLLAAIARKVLRPPLWSMACYLGAIVAGAWFVAPKAWFAVRRLRPDMNLLMAIAVAGAIAIGEWFEGGAVSFLFAVALLLESWSVGRARRAIKALVGLSPQVARVRTDEGTVEMPVDDVAVGSLVVVPPGERIPLDGVVKSGSSAVDQAPITGESIPVTKQVGDEVFAGTVNGAGALELRSTRPASDSQVARIIKLVEEAQTRRAPSEQWVERFARYYTPVMLALGVLIAVVPPLIEGGRWATWLYQALVVLVIACPCALVISTPVSIVAGLTTAARHGVLIKGGVHLEAPARFQAVALDKTGTLTHGTPAVQSVVPLDDHTDDELLAIAAALEANSTHPLARAISAHAREAAVEVPAATDFQMLPGKGATAAIGDTRYWIGSHRLMEERGIETPEAHETARRMEDAAHSVVAIGNDRHVCGLISVSDTIREESASAIAAMKTLGVRRVVMLTGDNIETAEAVGATTGVDEVRAELLPEDKVSAVTELAREHQHVAMVGDGVNDAPALAAASTGIAMGSVGTAAAVETADIALMSDEIERLPWLIVHSRRTLSVVKQNIVFALGLKLAFIVLATLGMATLWMAIAADMGASLLVILNGLRLLEPGAPPDKNGVCLHSPPTASRASVGAKNHVCDGRCDGR